MCENHPTQVDDASRLRVARRALDGVNTLRQAARDAERRYAQKVDATTPTFWASARNLVHYLAVRSHDIRDLQADLARLGLSSLGRMESHAMASLDLVAAMLTQLLGETYPQQAGTQTSEMQVDQGMAMLAQHATAILGAVDRERSTRIMVTMPGEAAQNPQLIHDLLAQGMQVMRINCAHDTPLVWAQMLRHLRHAERRLGRKCKVSFDLAGPKLRTGPIAPAAGVVKCRPQRDDYGRVMAPALVLLTNSDRKNVEGRVRLPVAGGLLKRARPGDRVELKDARGLKRRFDVIEVGSDGCLCRTERTAYMVSGIKLCLRRGKKVLAKAVVGALPPKPLKIMLRPGDMLDVVYGAVLGHVATSDSEGVLISPAMIGCEIREIFAHAQAGERIFFDDGRFEGMIRTVSSDRMRVEITGVTGGSAKLGAEKGINLPDTDLPLPAMTTKDKEDLDFVVRHADMVALSFVQRAEDVNELLDELHRRNRSQLGIVLKIETRRAFTHLPSLLLAAMRHPLVAVMVARGDLGVEVGFERLSEVQEEILWICEAAHIPVVWATQVLESLAKKGLSSRAEVTDAAMSGRAECVMLNKGPFILEAVSFLAAVLHRMQAHQVKKTATFRRLQVSNIDE